MSSIARHLPTAVLCTVGLLLVGAGVFRVVGAPLADLPTAHPAVVVSADQRQPPNTPPTAPVRLDVPSIGVRAPVVPVGVDQDGELAVPDDPLVVGWWSDGGLLAQPGGALVLAGHVDTAAQGLGALFYLAELAPGDPLSVTGADGWVRRFRVTAVRAYPKSTLPADLFRPSGELVVVTCGGHFDRGTRQYADNVVAYAEPVS